MAEPARRGRDDVTPFQNVQSQWIGRLCKVWASIILLFNVLKILL